MHLLLTKPLDLSHFFTHQPHKSPLDVQIDSSDLVVALTEAFGQSAQLCWLHDAGQDVIGLYPAWLVKVLPNQQQDSSGSADTPSSNTLSATQLMTTERRVLSSSDYPTALMPSAPTETVAAHYQKETSVPLRSGNNSGSHRRSDHDTTMTPDHSLSVSQQISQCITRYMASQQSKQWQTPSTKQEKRSGFFQGLMGFINYDIAANYTAQVTHPVPQPASYPQLCLGHYDIYLQQRGEQWQVVFEPEAIVLATALKTRIEQLKSVTTPPQLSVSADTASPYQNQHKPTQTHCHLYQLSPHWSRSEYAAAFDRVQAYLSAGDCYQVNLAQHLTANYTGNPAALLPTLHRATRAPYAGYMQVHDFSLLSCSPELFVAFDSDGQVTTKPIKGTLPRLADTAADTQQKDALRACDKNQAENLMIVDLLRNDLSVFAKTGTVQVPRLFDIESFAQVHHMVSTITAKLKDDVSPIDVLLTALPGGSITGAPKIRAIEIIHELEKQPRGAYCGSMGYLNFDGSGEWNILIRTLQFWQGKMSLWAGGGITIASDCDDEYQECMDKISGILSVLEDNLVNLDDD